MLFHCRENIQLKNGGLWSRGNIILRVKVRGEAENLRDEWFIAPLDHSLPATPSRTPAQWLAQEHPSLNALENADEPMSTRGTALGLPTRKPTQHFAMIALACQHLLDQEATM
jgi:hypothetical protein